MGLGISQGGPGRLSDREYTALRGARVAIGPRKHRLGGARTTIRLSKHVTSRGPGHNRAEKTLHSEGPESQSDSKNTVHPGPGGPAGRKNTQFTRARSHQAASGGLPRAPPGLLSRIHPGRALWPANGATRRKSRRENTVLSERRLRRSRARGAVRFRTRHPSRGSGTSACGLRINLREI